ncbi:TetR/AcrR family transcriptional regulator [Cohnella luojiensis]|uniref:TetR/AcrR family transcriptional regulator n=1 Tax=Cohnella luojiensis TaxID=652876 RepID=A0A4Y8LPR2_9BACL|nr:TetR/AcrR family transcriptional regulator [Cohnella luojiensis]TFE19537.1 TetR/AcrR family transcriptional regulator [Cohnella luojiensis]
MARTKEFDENAVLLKAMRLFWEQGYEKTSMQELVSHMGIHKGSLYDTFGDKQSLYVKALKRYIEMFEQSVRLPVKRRMADTRSAKEAIRMMLEIAVQQKEEFPDGCFMVNTAVELAKHDSICRDLVKLGWATVEQLIYDIIVEGQQSGEISKALNAEWLSHYFNNAIIGLRVMVKTITDREKFRQIIDMNMSVLE